MMDALAVSDVVTNVEGTYRVRVENDPFMPSPRDDFYQLGTMVLSHRRYNLPREGELVNRIDEAFERGGLRLVMRYLSVVHDAVVLPVYGYDHGELRLKAGERTYPFSDQWDSGLAGVIYAQRASIAEEFDGQPMPCDETIAGWLATEVEQYDTWANDEMTGYVIEQLTGEDSWDHVDSCWGYYSVNEAMQEGLAAVPDGTRFFMNAAGRGFTVRALQAGERYGSSGQYAADVPLVEFYDATFAGKGAYPRWGQEVTRYKVSSLLDRDEFGGTGGLDLHGGIPEWSIDEATMAKIRAWLTELFPIVKPPCNHDPSARKSACDVELCECGSLIYDGREYRPVSER